MYLRHCNSGVASWIYDSAAPGTQRPDNLCKSRQGTTCNRHRDHEEAVTIYVLVDNSSKQEEKSKGINFHVDIVFGIQVK